MEGRQREEGDGGRNETKAKLRAVEEKYHNLLMHLNKLSLKDKRHMSEVESELKLKKFELERMSLLYSDVSGKVKDVSVDKERLAEKLDVLRDEYSASKLEADQTITSLKLQLHEKSVRLETYDKLEAELDKVVIQAATLPCHQDADEILSAYGYGASIPSSAKRRLEQSLKLARRILELEHKTTEQKNELFSFRDKNLTLNQELEALKFAMNLSGHPTSELLEVIKKRDITIAQQNEKIKELNLSVKRITDSNFQLQEKIIDLERKLKETSESEPSGYLYKRFAPLNPTPQSSRTVISSGSSKRGLSVSFLEASQSSFSTLPSHSGTSTNFTTSTSNTFTNTNSSTSHSSSHGRTCPRSPPTKESSASSYFCIRKPLTLSKMNPSKFN